MTDILVKSPVVYKESSPGDWNTRFVQILILFYNPDRRDCGCRLLYFQRGKGREGVGLVFSPEKTSYAYEAKF